MKPVVLVLAAVFALTGCLVGDPFSQFSSDAGADEAPTDDVADAAVEEIAFGVVVSPRHGELVDGPAGQASFEFSGFHQEPGYEIEIQTLADPDDFASWTTIGRATTSTDAAGGTDAPYAFSTSAAPGSRAFPDGGIVRFRAVGQDGDVLASLFHDSDECIDAASAGDWRGRVSECGGALPYFVLVSPNRSPIPADEDSNIASRPLFLTETGVGSPEETLQYYDTINAPATVADFRDLYGLDDPNLPSATFYNAGDLAAGREIRCNNFATPAGVGLACYSANYGEFSGDPDEALDLAVAGTEAGNSEGAFATVSMVFEPPITAPNSVQFIVYGANGALIDEAELDRFGDNASIPQNCLNCHASDAVYDPASNTVTGARFLPFDPGQFEFSTEPGFRRADQEDEIRKLNQLVLGASPSVGVREYVEGMYHDQIATPGTVADLEFVPEGWRASARDRAVYTNVVEPFCRACHATREGEAGTRDLLDFTTAESLRVASAMIGRSVCGPANLPDSHSMPNAEAVLERFWASPARAYLAEMTNARGSCSTK